MLDKEKLMEEVGEIIGQLLVEQEAGEVTLSDIEQAVMTAGQQIEAKLTEQLVETHARRVSRATICSVCGEKLRYKGYRKKELVTRTGEVSVNRAYYYCKTCQQGFFPPG